MMMRIRRRRRVKRITKDDDVIRSGVVDWMMMMMVIALSNKFTYYVYCTYIWKRAITTIQEPPISIYRAHRHIWSGNCDIRAY